MNGVELQPCVQPLRLDLDLVGWPALRDAIGSYEAVYNKRYTLVYRAMKRYTR